MESAEEDIGKVGNLSIRSYERSLIHHVTPQHHRCQRQHHKVRSPGKVGDLVKLAGAGDEEEGELHGNCDDPADCQVVCVTFKDQHVGDRGMIQS